MNYRFGGDAVRNSLTGGFSWQLSKGERSEGSVSGLLLAPGTKTPVINNFFNPVQFADTTAPRMASASLQFKF